MVGAKPSRCLPLNPNRFSDLCRHARYQRSIAEMRPLSFQTNTADLDVSVVHVFDTERGDIALSLQST